MARIYGLNGLIRGRQGNNVFSIQNGTQVLKAYNPAVANPRTEAQELQRAKFALVGKISGCAPSIAFAGLAGSSARNRRANFVSRCVRAAVATAAADNYTASIAYRDIMFSTGSLAKYSSGASVTASIANSGVVSVSVPAMGVLSSAPAGYGEMLVVGCFDGSASPLDNFQVALRSRSAANAFSFELRQGATAVVVVWYCPFVAGSRTAGLLTGNLGTNTTSNSIELIARVLAYASDAEWGNSISSAPILVNPTNSAVSPSPDDNRGGVGGDEPSEVTKKK